MAGDGDSGPGLSTICCVESLGKTQFRGPPCLDEEVGTPKALLSSRVGEPPRCRKLIGAELGSLIRIKLPPKDAGPEARVGRRDGPFLNVKL